MIKIKERIIDATDKPLGRLATQIALILRGKNKPSFLPYKDEGDFVLVKNIDKIKFTGKKKEQKFYYSHSGYPGGFKEIVLKKIFLKDPEKVLRLAVLGMLSKNKLRAKIIKKLRIEEIKK